MLLFPKLGSTLLLTVLPLPVLIVAAKDRYRVDVERWVAHFGTPIRRLAGYFAAIEVAASVLVVGFYLHMTDSHVLDSKQEDPLVFTLAIATIFAALIINGLLAGHAILRAGRRSPGPRIQMPPS